MIERQGSTKVNGIRFTELEGRVVSEPVGEKQVMTFNNVEGYSVLHDDLSFVKTTKQPDRKTLPPALSKTPGGLIVPTTALSDGDPDLAERFAAQEADPTTSKLPSDIERDLAREDRTKDAEGETEGEEVNMDYSETEVAQKSPDAQGDDEVNAEIDREHEEVLREADDDAEGGGEGDDGEKSGEDEGETDEVEPTEYNQEEYEERAETVTDQVEQRTDEELTPTQQAISPTQPNPNESANGEGEPAPRYDQMTVGQLRDTLRERDTPYSGLVKDDLIKKAFETHPKD